MGRVHWFKTLESETGDKSENTSTEAFITIGLGSCRHMQVSCRYNIRIPRGREMGWFDRAVLSKDIVRETRQVATVHN